MWRIEYDENMFEDEKVEKILKIYQIELQFDISN